MTWYESSLSFTALRRDARDAFGELMEGNVFSGYDKRSHIIDNALYPTGAQVFMTLNGIDYVLEMRYQQNENFCNCGEGYGSVKIRATNEGFLKTKMKRARTICERYRSDPEADASETQDLCSAGIVKN